MYFLFTDFPCLLLSYSVLSSSLLFTHQSLDPTNTAARNNRALCSLQQSHWKAAADDTSRVLDAEPNNAKVKKTLTLEQSVSKLYFVEYLWTFRSFGLWNATCEDCLRMIPFPVSLVLNNHGSFLMFAS